MINKPSRATVHLLRKVTHITKVSPSLMQRVLYDFERTRLSRRRMIWLLPHQLHPPASILSLFLSLPVCRRSSLLTGEGGRGWGRSQIIRRRESLVLYKSFNTLRSQALPDISFLKQTSSRECFAPMTEKWKITQLRLQVCPCVCLQLSSSTQFEKRNFFIS
jgi:hypothetical protein